MLLDVDWGPHNVPVALYCIWVVCALFQKNCHYVMIIYTVITPRLHNV